MSTRNNKNVRIKFHTIELELRLLLQSKYYELFIIIIIIYYHLFNWIKNTTIYRFKSFASYELYQISRQRA